MGKKKLLDFSAENVGNEAFLIIRVFSGAEKEGKTNVFSWLEEYIHFLCIWREVPTGL